MPKNIQTEIARWMRTRFKNDGEIMKLFDISRVTLVAWKHNPPKHLLEYAKLFEKNIELQEFIFDLQNELYIYKIKKGEELIEDMENGRKKQYNSKRKHKV